MPFWVHRHSPWDTKGGSCFCLLGRDYARNCLAYRSFRQRTGQHATWSTAGRCSAHSTATAPERSSQSRQSAPLGRQTKSQKQGRGGRPRVGGRGSGRRGSIHSQNPQLHGNRILTKRQKERVEKEPAQRLAKVIAQAGIASRRAAEDLVTSGAVKVNGVVTIIPQHMVFTSLDEIVVNGKPLPRSAQRYYFALNKPKGYLCANRGAQDASRERLVVDLFQPWIQQEWRPKHTHPNAVPPRLFTVGRLDVQTSGLIFVTNDGEWAQKVQHPSNKLTKEYVVTLAKAPTARELEAVAAGCVVDGAYVQPKGLTFAAADRRDKLRVVIGEGRNREVRVLMEKAGLEVSSLKRVRIGGFRLPRDLTIGEFRELKSYQVARVIDKSVEMNPQTNSALLL